MNQREKADFTQGSILNKLIPFMMPVLGALVLQAAPKANDDVDVKNHSCSALSHQTQMFLANNENVFLDKAKSIPAPDQNHRLL